MAASFDVFLSHDHQDAAVVERLGQVLHQDHGFKVWLDRWVLVPGASWQQEIHKALREATTCAICIGAETAEGWFRQEIEHALDIQAANPDYRVIPVLLPGAPPDCLPRVMPAFVGLRTWVDFRPGEGDAYALHVLSHGIRGQAPGPWPPRVQPSSSQDELLQAVLHDLRALERLRPLIHDEVAMEYERRILARRFT